MADGERMRYEVHDGVAWLTMCRPEARNALDAALRSALWQALRRFRDDNTARVAVLAGEGEVFCAGGDLREMADTSMTTPPADYLPQLNRNLILDKPVIAAVQGAALGGGFLLAQSADLCVATEDAVLGIPEARWGRGAPWAAPLPWLVPPRVALEMLLTGEPLTASRAYDLGLVNAIARRAELLDVAGALAARIAANAPLSVRAGKEMVYLAAGVEPETAFERAEAAFAPVYVSADAQEGPRAFRERRTPAWRGA